MPTKWLLEPELFQEDANELINSLERQNIEYKVCQFGKPYEEYLNVFEPNDCVVFYGSLQFGRLIQHKAKWIPGVYCNLPKFECLYYYPRFGRHLVNSEYIMMPFGDLIRNQQNIFKDSLKVFLRPSSGFKTFTGFVVDYGSWKYEINLLKTSVDPETLMVIGRVAKIQREWRCVVANKHVITGSQYREGENIVRIGELPNEVLTFAQHIVETCDYSPDPVWTLDICELDSGEFKVVEVGSFSCAGLYASEYDVIVKDVSEIALNEWQDYQ